MFQAETVSAVPHPEGCCPSEPTLGHAYPRHNSLTIYWILQIYSNPLEEPEICSYSQEQVSQK